MTMRNSFRDKELKRFASLLDCDSRFEAKQKLNGYKVGLLNSGVKSPTRLERINLLEKFIDTL